MSRGLAYHRHQERRIKRRGARVLRGWSTPFGGNWPGEPDPKEVGLAARHGLMRCQHVCCHNPRRHFGTPTVQELRAEPLAEELETL